MRQDVWICDRCKRESRNDGFIKWCIPSFPFPKGHAGRTDEVRRVEMDLCKNCLKSLLYWVTLSIKGHWEDETFCDTDKT